MPEELKPCPACGASVRLEGGDQWYNQNSFVIRCEDPTCGCIRVGDTERDECIRRWNALPRAPHITPNDVDCKGCPERRPGLVWTDEPPKVPGWYWWRGYKHMAPMPLNVQDGVIVQYPITTLRAVSDVYGKWAGPIPMPKDEP